MTTESCSSFLSEDSSTNVVLALEMLQEEVEKEIKFVNDVGSNAFVSGDHGMVKESLERSKTLTAFQNKVVALHKEWQELAASVDRSEDEKVRLPKGQRTPESEFVEPILRVLEEMGGSGKAVEVVERVGQVMKPILCDVDYDLLKSDGKPHWQKTANWARRNMVNDGLLRSNSPRGMWEISEKGLALLSSSVAN